MTRELQDLAWDCLPKEFKEEVKDDYKELVSVLDYFQNKISLNNEECDRCDLIREKRAIYNKYFGKHNLTSNAEGEKMLYVKRKWVQEMYKNNCDEIRRENISSSDKDCYEYANEVLKTLFGSKCLPDELTEDNFAKLHGVNLSPEPKPAPTFADAAPTFADDCKSRPNRTQSSYTQPVTNCHRSDRLHIAAMAMQALLSNADRMKMYEEVASDPLSDNLTRIVAHNALRYADALVAEAQKGGSHEKDNVQ